MTRVAAIGTLASYVTDKPYVGQNLGVMAPGILRDVGDVAQIAALIAPRRLIIAGGVSGDGRRAFVRTNARGVRRRHARLGASRGRERADLDRKGRSRRDRQGAHPLAPA